MQQEPVTELEWVVYMLKCADGTLYTGCTNDLTARLAKHNAGTGAKYTRGRGPVQLVYTEKQKDRSTALKREIAIKKMSRADKEKHVSNLTSKLLNAR